MAINLLAVSTLWTSVTKGETDQQVKYLSEIATVINY
jgi:hypothetical protein